MQITDAEIKNTAHMARLALSETSLATYQTELTKIFNWVSELSAIDTQDLPPMAHPLAFSQRLREDTVSEEVERDALQAIAPHAEHGYYLVPQMIDAAE